jgi:DNA-binding MarR family transcriptional regulator
MTALTPDELRLWHAWKRASDAVRARVGEEITAETGLSDPDFGVLSRLEDLGHGRLRQNELAASMGWHRSRLSHQLTRMEERGLIDREDVQRGVQVSVVITEAGRTAIATARPVHATAVRRHLAAHVPADQLPQFIAALESLAG